MAKISSMKNSDKAILSFTTIIVVMLISHQYFSLQFSMIRLFNADALYIPDLSRDVLTNGLGQILLWNLSRSPGLIEAVLFIPINYIFDTFQAIAVFFILKILVTMYFVYRIYSLRYHASYATLYTCITITILTSVLLLNGNTPFYLILKVAHHYFEFLISLVSAVFLLQYISDNKKEKLIGFFLLCLIGCINDQLYYLHFIIPSLIFLVFYVLVLKRNIKKNINLGLCIIIASIFGYLISSIILDSQIQNAQIKIDLDISRYFNELMSFKTKFLKNNNLFSIFIILIFFLYCLHSIIFKNKDKIWSAFFILSFLITILILLINPSAKLNLRYFLPYIFIPTLFFWLCFPVYKGALFKNILMAVLLVLTTFNLLLFTPQRWYSNYYPKAVECVDYVAKENGISSIISDYWNARKFTFLSKHGVNVIPFNKKYERVTIVNNRTRYQENYSAVLVYGGGKKRKGRFESDSIIKTLGRPSKIEFCGEVNVLLYPKNSLFRNSLLH